MAALEAARDTMELMDHPPTPQMVYEMRMRWGLSQQDAGELIGSSRQAWQKWENGQRTIPKPIQYLIWLMDRRSSVWNAVRKFHTRHVSLGPENAP